MEQWNPSNRFEQMPWKCSDDISWSVFWVLGRPPRASVCINDPVGATLQRALDAVNMSTPDMCGNPSHKTPTNHQRPGFPMLSLAWSFMIVKTDHLHFSGVRGWSTPKKPPTAGDCHRQTTGGCPGLPREKAHPALPVFLLL